MAIICWGNLAKSADDTARIEQSMQDYVEGHNINVNAHQVEGSSLYMHRVNEKLDHLEGSVGLQYLPLDKKFGFSFFESLDGWQVSDVTKCLAHVLGARLLAYYGTTVWINAYPYTASPAVRPSKNPLFQTTVRLVTNTFQEIFFGAGAHFSEVNNDCWGFRIVDAICYAYWTSNGTVYSQELAGVTVGEFNCYRARIDSTLGEMYFYVNGVLKYTATSNLPVVETSIYFEYFLENTAGAGGDNRFLYPVDWMFQQDR
jgi:hypothetical protein